VWKVFVKKNINLGDLSFYAYYTLWRNDRMPMYVVSCTSPRTEGKEYVEAAFSYFQKNKYPPTVRYDEANLVSFSDFIFLHQFFSHRNFCIFYTNFVFHQIYCFVPPNLLLFTPNFRKHSFGKNCCKKNLV